MNGIHATQADERRLQEKEEMLASAFGDSTIPLIQLNADGAFSLLYDYLSFLLNYPDMQRAYASYYANEGRLRNAWRLFHDRNLQPQARDGGIQVDNINMRSDSINRVLTLLFRRFLHLRGGDATPLRLDD
ncbi:hypothetical protein SCHPADRAFT_945398 [Schizopora paradoxa]|uniref:Uncharacterized protein n=1 Tax=Schizopora paradoxa TaxID=27342 RepID=A0A0H2RR31_9AGAM|nr:hypothetical protein SCHPADRAFT_945398 [Schizopora paradoxa]